MAGETERIEKEIVKAREELAGTLDKLAERGNPQRLADDAKTRATDVANKPAVKYGLIGAGVLVVALVVRKVVS